MTIQEMHIGIDLHLQKVNSNYIDVLLPEEKDFFLNEEQIKFINTRISAISNDKKKGLEFDQKRYDDLEKLKEPYSATALIKDNRSGYINLPDNYLHLINDRTELDDLCNKSFDDFEPQEFNGNYFVFGIKKDTSLKGFKIHFNNTLVFDLANYPIYANISLEETFSLINLVLYTIGLDYTIYWEYYNGVYYPNKFIVEDLKGDIEKITITYPEPTPDVIEQINPIPIDEEFYESEDVIEVPNRLTKTEDIYEVLRGAFTKTSKKSPVSEIIKGQLIVFHDRYFILTKINIDYIRKPQPVSLSLNQSCELDVNIHQELVEETAKSIAAFIESRNYPQLNNENNTKE